MKQEQLEKNFIEETIINGLSGTSEFIKLGTFAYFRRSHVLSVTYNKEAAKHIIIVRMTDEKVSHIEFLPGFLDDQPPIDK